MGRITDLIFGKRDAGPVTMAGFPSAGGVLPYGVSNTSVVGLPTVWRCLDVLAGGVSQLEWSEYRGTLDLPLSRLSRQPSSFYTRREWVQLVVRTMALYDTCYLLKVGGTDSEGVPMGLWPVPPSVIVPRTLDTYFYTPPTSYQVGRSTFDADQFVIVRRGPLPAVPDYLGGILNLARASLGESLAAMNYGSRYWQAGGAPTTVLTTDANLSIQQATDLGNSWAQRRAQGPDTPAILPNGLKASMFGADPTTQSGTDARRAMDAGIAKYFGIPGRLANVEVNDKETYKTAQEENLDLVKYTLTNYIQAIEDAISGLLPGQRVIKMQDSVLYRGTELSRAQSYQLALGTGGMPGWMTVGEIREAEGLPPIEQVGPDDDSQEPQPPALPGPQLQYIDTTTGRPSS